MRKYILLLGASQDQLFIIKTARDMGVGTVVIDANEDAPGIKMADIGAAIDFSRIDEVVAFINDLHSKKVNVCGVATMGSDVPHIVAEISNHYGWVGPSFKSGQVTTDKYKMKMELQKNGIPIPWFQEITSVSDLQQAVVQRGYPLVIKPTDRSGSRGVLMIEKGCNLAEMYERSKEISFSGTVQVEEFLEGMQISTETVMFQGKGVTPGIAERNYSQFKNFLPQIMENGGWIPTELSSNDQKDIENLVVRTSLALGITDGTTKGDVVMTRKGPKIIELAARLSGGDFCESLIPLSSGVNIVKAAVQIAIGEKPNFEELKPKFQKAVVNRYFFPNPGKLIKIEGIQEVMEQKWVKKLEFWYKVGDNVPKASNHSQRFGVFIVVGENRGEVDARSAWVYDKINIVTEAVV